MGILHRLTNLSEEFQTLGQGKAIHPTIYVDRLPFHIFHDEIRHTFSGIAAVVKGGDIRVLQGGENLSLHPQATQHGRIFHIVAHDFDHHRSPEGIVPPGRQVDCAHAALADFS